MLNIRPDTPAGGDASHHTCLTSDGTALHYRDLGTGPVVLLVHGWAASADFFDALAERLSADFRVIVPDLRAHGQTATGPAALSMDLLAADLQNLIEHLSLTHIVVLGWSMGAIVVWRMFARYGHERFAGLVIEDMSPRILNSEDWALGMSTGLDIAGSGRATESMRSNWPAYAAAFAPRMFARGRAENEPEMIAQVIARLGRRDGQAMADLWLSMAGQDLREALPAMNLPTLITYGERSEAYGPETSRYLVEALPDAQTIAFSKSGHAPHLEEPEEFAQAVAIFAHRACTAATNTENLKGTEP